MDTISNENEKSITGETPDQSVSQWTSADVNRMPEPIAPAPEYVSPDPEPEFLHTQRAETARIVEPIITPAPVKPATEPYTYRQTPGPVKPAPVASPVNPYQPARPEGVTLTAIYHFLSGIPMLLLALMFLVIMVFMPVAINDSAVGLTFAILALGFFFVLFLVLGGLAVVTGVGLLRMKNWARWLAIAQSVLNLLNFPIGTIIGGLIIVYMLSDSTRIAFEQHNR